MDSATNTAGQQRKAGIFLVEDEVLIVEDLKDILTNYGCDVIGTARSGKHAIEQIKRLVPDLIIIDLRIEGNLNGIEVAIVVQSFFDFKIPLIFLTGFSPSTFSKLKILPDCIYLKKPFQEKDLLNAVERALSQSKSTQK